MNRFLARGPLPLIVAFLLLVCGVVVAGSDVAPEYSNIPVPPAPGFQAAGCSGSAQATAIPAGYILVPAASVAAFPTPAPAPSGCHGGVAVAQGAQVQVAQVQQQKAGPVANFRAKSKAARAARKATTATTTVQTVQTASVVAAPAAVVPACVKPACAACQ